MTEPSAEMVRAAVRVLADYNRRAVAGFREEEIDTVTREMLRAALAAESDPLGEPLAEDDPRIIEAGERLVEVVTARAGEDDELVFQLVQEWSHTELLYTFVIMLAAYVESRKHEVGEGFPVILGMSLQTLREHWGKS